MGIKPITNDELRITVYPNQTTGELRITNSELRIANVEIYDVMGRKIPLQFIEGVDGEAGRGGFRSYDLTILRSYALTILPPSPPAFIS